MNHTLKNYPGIDTGGIQFVSGLDGAAGWFWGMDYTAGDLYEAEELYREGHAVTKNRLIFLHFPEGKVFEPVKVEAGQYLGKPVFWEERIFFPLVDFRQETITVIGWEPEETLEESRKPKRAGGKSRKAGECSEGKANGLQAEEPTTTAEAEIVMGAETEAAAAANAPEKQVILPLSCVKDCYNLQLTAAPLTLIRQGHENDFQLLWPEQGSFGIAPTESLDSRDGDILLFSKWFEDPDYREETVIRRIPDGKILEQLPGSLFTDPDGKRWVLK